MPDPQRYRHRAITDEDLVFIRNLIAEHPGASRLSLSKKLCAAWNWVQANGALRDMMCRGMMLMLHRAGLIELPPVRWVTRNPMVERSRPVFVNVDQTTLRMGFTDLGPLDVSQVRRTPEEPLLNSLLQQHHYPGYQQPLGEHLKYLVYAQGRALACVAWSSAPRHLGSRGQSGVAGAGLPGASRRGAAVRRRGHGADRLRQTRQNQAARQPRRCGASGCPPGRLSWLKQRSAPEAPDHVAGLRGAANDVPGFLAQAAGYGLRILMGNGQAWQAQHRFQVKPSGRAGAGRVRVLRMAAGAVSGLGRLDFPITAGDAIES